MMTPGEQVERLVERLRRGPMGRPMGAICDMYDAATVIITLHDAWKAIKAARDDLVAIRSMPTKGQDGGVS